MKELPSYKLPVSPYKKLKVKSGTEFSTSNLAKESP
jgi:hypothetical protein